MKPPMHCGKVKPGRSRCDHKVTRKLLLGSSRAHAASHAGHILLRQLLLAKPWDAVFGAVLPRGSARLDKLSENFTMAYGVQKQVPLLLDNHI